MIDVIIYFIFQVLVIYVPLLIKKKVNRDKVLVWSTIWATLFTSSCISILLTILELINAGYTMTTIDYIISIGIVLIIICNIPTIKLFNKLLMKKKNIL